MTRAEATVVVAPEPRASASGVPSRSLSVAALSHRLVGACLLIGGVVFVVGLLADPQRTWANVLLISYYLLGLSLAGALIMAFQYVTGAGWGVALRRVPEAMAATLPVGAVGLIAVLLAYPSLYSWSDAAHAEAASSFKHAWLHWPLFLARSAIYLACWHGLVYLLLRASRRQDVEAWVSYTRQNVRRSALFLVVFAVTFWLASYDWIMSLEPEWYSTVFGVYNFAGAFVSGLAVMVLLVVALERLGPFRNVLTAEHLHDLGKLLFAFSTFWVYLWFCQYMLIWYVNNPEETSYYLRRFDGVWQPLFYVNVVLNWLVPFVVLLPRSAKRNIGVLVKVCVVLLVGRWLDLYLMVMPSLDKHPAIAGEQAVPLQPQVLIEGGIVVGVVGLFALAVVRALSQAPLVPIHDPYLTESLQHGKGEREITS